MIALIAARSRNNVIGKGGRIPWKICGEQKQFKDLTTNEVVIMGRRTYEEIGHPLPDRKIIVVSHTGSFAGEDVKTAHSLEEAIEKANGNDVYIAGGYELYKAAIPLTDIMYITEVDLMIEDGDVFFPEFDKDDFELFVGETLGRDIRYTRTTSIRKKRKR